MAMDNDQIEAAFASDGMQIRPMTEVESNLMTEVLALRRQVGAVRRLHHCDPPMTYCKACGHAPMPCPTINAIDANLT